jgi:hypothetical protein
MDGTTLLRSLREAVGEASGSQYLDTRTSYQLLWEAAIELVRRTRCLRATQAITTVAGTSSYTINADFLKLDLRNTRGEYIIKYYTGASTYFVEFGEYNDIIYANQTSSQSIPNRFAIIDKSSLYPQITGTATSAGTSTAGLSTLTDTAGLFTTTDYVSVGDYVSNTTGASSGIVLAVTDATHLDTAMFDNSSGISAAWSSSDAYVIQPQGRLEVLFDPPLATSGHTATIYYIQRPAPVFHDHGVYRFSPTYMNSLVSYAASKYKLADREPGTWDAFRKEWAGRLGEVSNAVGNTFNRSGFRMSLRGVK